MRLVQDVARFAYTDNRFPFGRNCACRIRIWKMDDGSHTVLMTDLGKDSPGASVTNTVETVASEVANRFSIDPETTVWIEHYEHAEGSSLPETFDLVSFHWKDGRAGQPKWNRKATPPDGFPGIKTSPSPY